ncbi:4a-hydroxytetrahydrobiopterin dehydratase [Rhizohabitans arisaemae]|uniref:4a-hydroxytetrahydrobiopterin dehydratase n=1 Tax=Rhizohabitans arisaemae TaxID=2720610 RepID=UPI0024B20772|nr:4a-hydroxytetrahydrobiopterin dehydratase [Rhizohabitans arisaemae]
MVERLAESDINERLADIPEWSRIGNEISRTVKAPTFLEGIAIVDEVAVAAEKAKHHPDIDIRWRDITFRLTTHDAGNVLTELDFRLAETIDTIATRRGA